MHIEYQISEADYLNAFNLYFRSRRGAWLRRYVLPVIYALLLLPLLYAAIRLHNRTSVILAPEIYLLGIGVFNRLMMRRKLVQRYRDNISIQSRNFIDIDHTGSRLRDVATDYFTPWSDYSAYLEDNTTFLRFMKVDTKFHITPKRELTPEQIDEFRALCKENLPERVVGLTTHGFLKGALATAVVVPVLWVAVPSLFWYYSVNYAAKHIVKPTTNPRPLSDTSIVPLDGPTFLAFGCSVQTPFTPVARPEPRPVAKRTGGDSDEDDDDDVAPVAPQDRYLETSFNNDFALTALNPRFQNDALANIRKASGWFAENVRSSIGAKPLSSPYEFSRWALYAQPSDVRVLAIGAYNHGVFQALVLKRDLLAHVARGDGSVYEIHENGVRAFQFGNSALHPFLVTLDLYDVQDRHLRFRLNGHAKSNATLSQGQISAMIASFRCDTDHP